MEVGRIVFNWKGTSQFVQIISTHKKSLSGRSLVSTRASRTLAVINSGVLENCGVTHDVVTQEEWTREYKTRYEGLSSRFLSKNHDMDKRFHVNPSF